VQPHQKRLNQNTTIELERKRSKINEAALSLDIASTLTQQQGSAF
jgi:hypothetical protein